MTPEPWYRDGLHFSCTQCGNCCTGAPGVVWVNDEEIAAIAAATGKSTDEVRLFHTRQVGGRISLTERSNGDCTFFDGQTRRCTIYPARPRQCRSWPFWNSNLATPGCWDALRETCPGVGHGTFVPLDEIRQRAALIDV